MARKKDTPQKAASGNDGQLSERKQCKGQGWNGCQFYHAGYDIHHLEGALDQEMDEELGYSKYDYRNKETDNSRNGHSQKTMHTSYGDMEIDIPRDGKVSLNHRSLKSIRIRSLKTWKKRSSPCMPKE